MGLRAVGVRVPPPVPASSGAVPSPKRKKNAPCRGARGFFKIGPDGWRASGRPRLGLVARSLFLAAERGTRGAHALRDERTSGPSPTRFVRVDPGAAENLAAIARPRPAGRSARGRCHISCHLRSHHSSAARTTAANSLRAPLTLFEVEGSAINGNPAFRRPFLLLHFRRENPSARKPSDSVMRKSTICGIRSLHGQAGGQTVSSAQPGCSSARYRKASQNHQPFDTIRAVRVGRPRGIGAWRLALLAARPDQGLGRGLARAAARHAPRSDRGRVARGRSCTRAHAGDGGLRRPRSMTFTRPLHGPACRCHWAQ